MHTKTLLMSSLAALAHGQELMNVLSNDSMLSNLTTYLSLFPAFMSQLKDMNNITLLAPSNEAFAQALNSSGSNAFAANDTEAISALLSYHILNGTYSNFSSMPEFIPTALMEGMYANVTGGQVVEVIGGGNSTNATAFSGLLSNSTIMANSTMNFTGGVLHVVDRFLQLPSNITDTAVQLGLRSAVGALQVAGLADAVDMLKDVTCFVPYNEAFQAVGGTLATASPDELMRILEYHVVNGTVAYSTDIMNGTNLTSYNDLQLTISIYKDSKGNDEIFVNSAKVITPNVLVANGVIHVIDGVLNPGNMTAKADATASSQAPAFSDASSASGTPFTSGVAEATTTVDTSSVESAMASATSAAGSGSSTSSGLAAPLMTGAIGPAALFGGAAVLLNL
jgi:uncharacterized surface protein with fasciclin (FAS1) repeats